MARIMTSTRVVPAKDITEQCQLVPIVLPMMPKAVVSKVCAPITSHPEPKSHKSGDMPGESAARLVDKTNFPPVKLSGLDPVVPSFAYDLTAPQPSFDPTDYSTRTARARERWVAP